MYAYRTRRPSGLGRHWGYVGQTSSFWHRHRQHCGLETLTAGDWPPRSGQPWADLDPRCYRIPLPNWKWLRLTVETLLIAVLWPVYNVQKNRWNPRRITPAHARAQRFDRNAGRKPIGPTFLDTLRMGVILFVLLTVIWVVIEHA